MHKPLQIDPFQSIWIPLQTQATTDWIYRSNCSLPLSLNPPIWPTCKPTAHLIRLDDFSVCTCSLMHLNFPNCKLGTPKSGLACPLVKTVYQWHKTRANGHAHLAGQFLIVSQHSRLLPTMCLSVTQRMNGFKITFQNARLGTHGKRTERLVQTVFQKWHWREIEKHTLIILVLIMMIRPGMIHIDSVYLWS